MARFVFLEELRRREREKAALRQLPGTHEEQGDDDDPRGACLEKCMAALDPDGRHLLLAYYQGQERERIERREQLAVKIGIGLGPLRNRVQRLREKVRACVDGCMRDTNPASETLPK